MTEFQHPFHKRNFAGKTGATDYLVDEDGNKLTDKHHSIKPVGDVKYKGKLGATRTTYVDKGDEVIKESQATEEDIEEATAYWATQEYRKEGLPPEWNALRATLGVFLNDQDSYDSLQNRYDLSDDVVAETQVSEQDFRELFGNATEEYPSQAHYLWGEVMDDMESLVIEDFFDEGNEVQPASRVIEDAESPQIKAINQGDSIRYLGEAEAVIGIDTFSIENEFEWINDEDYELVVSIDVPQEEALEVFSKFGQDDTG